MKLQCRAVLKGMEKRKQGKHAERHDEGRVGFFVEWLDKTFLSKDANEMRSCRVWLFGDYSPRKRK